MTSILADSMSPRRLTEIRLVLRKSLLSSTNLRFLQRYTIQSILNKDSAKGALDPSLAAAHSVDNGKSRPYSRTNGGTKGYGADFLGMVSTRVEKDKANPDQ